MVKSYSVGESGDQSRGSGICSSMALAGPVAVATCLPPRAAVTVASSPPNAVTSEMTTLPEVDGVIFAETMYSSGTCSIHTVCHIPDTGVYQMPPGLRTCLPWS